MVLVLSGKGGVGKSLVSAAASAHLARSGWRVGLMDADIYGPSSALLFGVQGVPEERESGLEPPVREGVKLMSVDLFAAGRPIPLTGRAAAEVLLEMMALTDWGDLDFLVVDMPPSTGDVLLFITSLERKNLTSLVVTMPDRLSTTVARRAMELLRSGGVPMVGVLGNMARSDSEAGRSGIAEAKLLAEEFQTPLLAMLPFDESVGSAVERSDVRALLKTRFAHKLGRAISDALGTA